MLCEYGTDPGLEEIRASTVGLGGRCGQGAGQHQKRSRHSHQDTQLSRALFRGVCKHDSIPCGSESNIPLIFAQRAQDSVKRTVRGNVMKEHMKNQRRKRELKSGIGGQSPLLRGGDSPIIFSRVLGRCEELLCPRSDKVKSELPSGDRARPDLVRS